jgi:hypothetical protein
VSLDCDGRNYPAAPLDLIDGLPSSKPDPVRVAIQEMLVDLMLDANEEIGACECRICQRLRRTARALEALGDSGD